MSPQPYGGVATFGRSALVEPSGDWHATVGVLGVPFDIAGGFRPGARFGPRAIRDASLRYPFSPHGFLDIERGHTLLAGVDVADAGDVELPSLEDALARERIEEAARAVRARCRLPLFLGGDHSISYPLLRAFDDVRDLQVVQLDAHLDFTDVRDGTRYSNSSPFRRASEAMGTLGRIHVFGLRGLRTDPEALAAARARGHELVPMGELHDVQAAAERLPEGARVYLSIDLDVLDPAVMPATSSPEVDGMRYEQLRALVRATAERNEVVAIDVVELAPQLDPTGRSSLVAARVAVEALAEALA